MSSVILFAIPEQPARLRGNFLRLYGGSTLPRHKFENYAFRIVKNMLRL